MVDNKDSREALKNTLCDEVVRKLNLARHAQTSQDRTIVCSEVFHDICGALEPHVQELLAVQPGASFYEVLAPFYAQVTERASELVMLCTPLWSQEYIPPVMALLLHVYLLTQGFSLARPWPLTNVVVDGCNKVFALDVLSSADRFQPLHAGLLRCVQEPPATRKARQLRDPAIKLVAGYMPYYRPPAEVLNGLLSLPPLSGARQSQHHVPDYMVYEFAAHLRTMPSKRGLLRYLDGLELVAQTLGPGDLFQDAPKAALENQLYFLSLPGGPRYCPVEVRSKALVVLEHIVPKGSVLRGFMRRCARLAQPKDLPHLAYVWVASMYASVCKVVQQVVQLLLSPWRRKQQAA